jgi:7-keto-8-aminopelargonate synthetase-like enzyme
MKLLTVEEKRKLVLEMISKKKAQLSNFESNAKQYEAYTYDMFMHSTDEDFAEAYQFSKWVKSASKDKVYGFESARATSQLPEVDLTRESGEVMHVLNFASYNYLGFGYHPEVIKAACKATEQYGLGAASAPVLSGTLNIHKQFENNLVDFFALPNRAVSLFSSGFGANLGTIQALVKPGSIIILDRSAHMSILDGARISGAEIKYFNHNDMDDLEGLLKDLHKLKRRMLICCEGVYSADGDFGELQEIVSLAKQYGAYTLVDEAHSTLLAGKNGRGVSEAQGVLDEVDFYIMTFSKAFSGIGGALLAKPEIIHYVNWFARCRMFSCALSPGVVGGMLKVLELAAGEEGRLRRMKLNENARYMRSLLSGKVNIGPSESWIIPIIYGDEKNTLRINDYLQRNGVDNSMMQFPATPKNESRLRLFITSEHTKPQLDQSAIKILQTAKKFNFLINP